MRTHNMFLWRNKNTTSLFLVEKYVLLGQIKNICVLGNPALHSLSGKTLQIFSCFTGIKYFF